MGALPDHRIAELLAPYLPEMSRRKDFEADVVPRLSIYLDLLLRWNARTNLTAIRDPEEIVRRHFGESLFTAVHLEERMPEGAGLLDFGSGAGFPGLPVQLYLPGLRCTLAESQGKKAAFLREAVRTLGLSTEVWAGRVEAMPEERRFWCVALRAVDSMKDAIPVAAKRVGSDGLLAVMAGEDTPLPDMEQFNLLTQLSIPESDRRMLYLYAQR